MYKRLSFPTEEWRACLAWPGYFVSSLGRVCGPRGWLLVPTLERNYCKVILYHDGHRHKRGIHRLVAEAFLGPPPTPRHEVNHRDGDKTHNMPANLEWVTHHENMRHATQFGLLPLGEAKPQAKLTAPQVLQIRLVQGQASLRSIARQFGVDHKTILAIQRGDTWAHV